MQHWDRHYAANGTSGEGSYGLPLLRKMELLKELPGIRTITDVGCGDFNFGAHLLCAQPDAGYFGLDVSNVIVERNQRLYSSRRAQFRVMNGFIPPADLVLCVDVLFHVKSPEASEALLQRLDGAFNKYLALSAYEYDRTEGLASHMAIRQFDPSRFGQPLVREIIEADGELYFYIFER